MTRFFDRKLEELKVCPHCKKPYICISTYQEPGCRDIEEEYCPHCKKIIRTSMEWHFRTCKVTEDDR